LTSTYPNSLGRKSRRERGQVPRIWSEGDAIANCPPPVFSKSIAQNSPKYAKREKSFFLGRKTSSFTPSQTHPLWSPLLASNQVFWIRLYVPSRIPARRPLNQTLVPLPAVKGKTDVTPAIYGAILSRNFIARQNQHVCNAHVATATNSINKRSFCTTFPILRPLLSHILKLFPHFFELLDKAHVFNFQTKTKLRGKMSSSESLD